MLFSNDHFYFSEVNFKIVSLFSISIFSHLNIHVTIHCIIELVKSIIGIQDTDIQLFKDKIFYEWKAYKIKIGDKSTLFKIKIFYLRLVSRIRN